MQISCTFLCYLPHAVAAEEVQWDYAPSGKNNYAATEDMDYSATYINKTEGLIGSVYKKALYFQYTNANFTERIPTDPSMGFLGPAIKAEVRKHY